MVVTGGYKIKSRCARSTAGSGGPGIDAMAAVIILPVSGTIEFDPAGAIITDIRAE
jgi:hypothetical protein